MMEYLSSSVAQAIIWLSVAAILSIAGWYFVTGWRDRNNSEHTTVDVLSNFREMRRQGVLNENEFRTIKTNLGERSTGDQNNDQRDAMGG